MGRPLVDVTPMTRRFMRAIGRRLLAHDDQSWRTSPKVVGMDASLVAERRMRADIRRTVASQQRGRILRVPRSAALSGAHDSLTDEQEILVRIFQIQPQQFQGCPPPGEFQTVSCA